MDMMKIKKKMVDLQVSFVDHAFYVATSMQSQTKSMVNGNISPIIGREGTRVLNDSMLMSQNATVDLQKAVNDSFTNFKSMFG